MVGDQFGEALCEVEPRVSGDDGGDRVGVNLVVAVTGDIDAFCVPEKIGLRPILERDLERRVQSDRSGERLASFRRPPLNGGEVGRNPRAVLLEAAAGVVAREQADVVQQRGDVEQFRVDADAINAGERDAQAWLRNE